MSEATITQIQVIETSTAPGRYGMPTTQAIIDHPKHGRLYLQQGYGGEQGMSGGAVRWRHGIICKLRPGDTLQSLRDGIHNDNASTLDAMVHGYDDARPALDWNGHMIEAIADASGL